MTSATHIAGPRETVSLAQHVAGALEGAPVGCVVVAPDGRVLAANSTYRRWIGAGAERGSDVALRLDGVLEVARARAQRGIASAVEVGALPGAPHRRGRWRVHAAGVAGDAVALTISDASLRVGGDSGGRFRMLAESAREGIVFHRRGTIVYANAAAVSMLGRESSNDLLGHSVCDLVDRGMGARAAVAAQLLLGDGESTFEAPLLRCDGAQMPVRMVVWRGDDDLVFCRFSGVRPEASRSTLLARAVADLRAVEASAQQAARLVERARADLSRAACTHDPARAAEALDAARAALAEAAAAWGSASGAGRGSGADPTRGRTSGSSRSGDSAAPGARLQRVLICDDEPKLAMLTAGLLEQHGWDSISVAEGEAALELLGASEPRVDVILLDVSLADLPAARMLQRMSDAGLEQPVILTSGYAAEDLPEGLLDHDSVAAYLAKPYSVEQLLEAMARAAALAAQLKAPADADEVPESHRRPQPPR